MIYQFWGKVRRHNQRGKKLGFPTANITLHKNIPEGIYISTIKIAKKTYKSLTFIGKAKTFNENKIRSETYILDFSKNLYNQWITVELLKKIRANKKFKSAKDLIKQMKKDEQAAREYLHKFPS